MNKKYEKKEGEGTLWQENEAEVLFKGSVLFDGADRYITILRSRNADGKSKLEVLQSLGLVYQNNDDKFSDRSPDISGPVRIDKKNYRFSGWKKETESGPPLLSVAITEKKESPFWKVI